jgi:hypothetical protein
MIILKMYAISILEVISHILLLIDSIFVLILTPLIYTKQLQYKFQTPFSRLGYWVFGISMGIFFSV